MKPHDAANFLVRFLVRNSCGPVFAEGRVSPIRGIVSRRNVIRLTASCRSQREEKGIDPFAASGVHAGPTACPRSDRTLVWGWAI